MAKLWKQTELLHLKENVPPLTKFIGYVNFTDCLKICPKASRGGGGKRVQKPPPPFEGQGFFYRILKEIKAL